MPDREKVIRGLECCAFGSLSDCEGCPYYIETRCSELLCGDALALLEEQEARVMMLDVGEDLASECGKTFRFWTSRPTPEQMRDTLWKGYNDE